MTQVSKVLIPQVNFPAIGEEVDPTILPVGSRVYAKGFEGRLSVYYQLTDEGWRYVNSYGAGTPGSGPEQTQDRVFILRSLP